MQRFCACVAFTLSAKKSPTNRIWPPPGDWPLRPNHVRYRRKPSRGSRDSRDPLSSWTIASDYNRWWPGSSYCKSWSGTMETYFRWWVDVYILQIYKWNLFPTMSRWLNQFLFVMSVMFLTLWAPGFFDLWNPGGGSFSPAGTLIANNASLDHGRNFNFWEKIALCMIFPTRYHTFLYLT